MNSLEKLKATWNNEGINPKNHFKAKEKLKREWPLLYRSIEGVLDEYNKKLNN